ncbi:penicillin-binding transpeptidase domain-containing protein [Knoellia subterranea]|uniref:Penicillin-binding protein n=1 Tax=Knoellia subterranea KCTC 19937 TaxID=1385521 RepID=A0A0A0JK31_9MICO|nr:penicillin-binding transpeptidase domain-containing protein [Knoellia subterranea]KGN37099.1 penicillin-binding protein [Knoellia subterranea KCTC 19937]
MRNGWGGKVGIAVVVAALLGVGVWGGLTLFGDREGEKARRAAEAVASGLAKGTFTDGSIADASGATPDLAPVVAGMGKVGHTVSVVSVSEPQDGAAKATLRHTWKASGANADWTYDVPLTVRKVGEKWVGEWAPGVVAPELTVDEKLRITRDQPDRAQILGAGGTPIVEPRPVQRIGIDKTKVSATEVATSARALAEAVGVNVDNYVKSVQNAGPQAFVQAIVARDGSSEEQAAREVDAPGVLLTSATIPLAPTASFARPLLGVVGDATAEIVEKSEGRVAAGDQVGIGGLQSAFDAQLSGTPALSVVATGGPEARTLFSTEATPGKPLTLTLDIATQEAAEKVLENVAPASAIVALRPSTGHILAAASGPGSKGISTATQGRYAPGSTFKTVSTLALLRAGVTPSSTVECTPTVTVDGRTFKNVDGYPTSALGSVPFSTAFANSCNTAFIRGAAQLEPADLPTAAAGLGLTAGASLGVPAFLGSVPSPEPGTDEAASMIGQSKVQASPLGMATVAASIAAGKVVTPVLVEGLTGGASDGASSDAPAESATPAPSPSPTSPVTAAEAAQLRTLMRGVVEQGSGRFLVDVPGAPVLAKSGTAEFGDAGALKEHAWMIGIQGDLAVAAFVEEGEGGAVTAGPLLEAFLRAT